MTSRLLHVDWLVICLPLRLGNRRVATADY